jgi:hypothetical protein
MPLDSIGQRLILRDAGVVPGRGAECADGRDKPGHDEVRESCMTAYLISLALAGLVAIALWEGFS